MERRLNHRLHRHTNNSNTEELRGLHVTTETGRYRRHKYRDDDDDDDDDNDDDTANDTTLLALVHSYCGNFVLLAMAAVFCWSFISMFMPSRTTTSTNSSPSSPSLNLINFTCPSSIHRSKQNHNFSLESTYEKVTKNVTFNMTQFFHEFRQSKYDGWELTYEHFKKGMYQWKSTHFTPLQSGDTIYESACGIGLNLHLTLEILQETRNITNLVVYGNEYVRVSADQANVILDHIAPAQARKGIICAGDSSDLYFVPSNAFDLVYTGYISPHLDPMHVNKSMNENFDEYTKACREGSNATERQQQLLRLVQDAQEEQHRWYDKWVREMIRIAKPGKAIIIEQVSLPFCEARHDWGGVSKGWWSHSLLSNWYDMIDPTSLRIQNDVIFRTRYNVYLRKKEKMS